MRSLALALLLMVALAIALGAQAYTDRATMGRDPIFISRVGVAVQQQAIIVEGEPPDVCCQYTTQTQMASSSGKQTIKSLCDVIIPAGSPTAPDATRQLSRDRHAARQRFSKQVIANASQWAADLAPIIASDACVPLDVTDATIQSYMVRLWDVMALPPDLSNAPFVPTAPPPVGPPPTTFKLPPPPKPPGGQR